MNFKERKILSIAVAILMTFGFSGCNDTDTNGKNSTADSQQSQSPDDNTTINQLPSGNTLTEITVDYLDTSDMFSDRELSCEYDSNDAELIELSGENAQTNAGGVSLKDGVLTITSEGVYVLRGQLDGQIVIEADESDKIQLVFDNATITTDKGCAVYVKSADKLFITTTEKSDNRITANGDAYTDGETNVDGAVFSKCDVCLNGKGTLEITSQANGVVSKDDVVIGGGAYVINAENHGIDGKDSVRIADGYVNINAGKDGIHSENTEDTTKGFVYVKNGTVILETEGDGISASSILQLENGNYTITTTGDSDKSSKGIKSSSNIIIQNGTYSVDSTDDGLHSALNAVVENGQLTISSDDDGIHCDGNVSINGGTVTVADSYEGIEGQTINLIDGVIEIHSSDDGINASGGNDQSGFGGIRDKDTFVEGSSAYINIAGGKITVYANGDGVDSNGQIYVSGGETAVIGPVSGGNGSIDCNGAEITGGTFIAVGSGQMAQNFSKASQGAFMINVSSGNQKVEIKDASGNVIYSLDPGINYSAVIFSSPEIKEGETYTVSANGGEATVEMTSIIVGSGNGMGGPGGHTGGGKGERPDNMQFPDDMGMTPPENMEQMPYPQF